MLSHKEHRDLKNYIQGINVSRMAIAFDALGEPNRCLIFRALLKESNASVGQLASALGISESLASQHLKVLFQAELVERMKHGKNVYYQVRNKDPLVNALRKAVC